MEGVGRRVWGSGLRVDDSGHPACGRGLEVLPTRFRKVDIRLPGNGNSNSYGARPVHQIMSMIKWIWTSRLSINDSLPLLPPRPAPLDGQPRGE